MFKQKILATLQKLVSSVGTCRSPLIDSATTESPIMDIRTIASNVHPPPEGFWSSDQCCVLRHIQSGSKPDVTNDVTAAHTDHATVRS